MTSDNQPTGYVASASSYYTTSPTYAPWKAFDNIKDGNSWISENISYNADGTATGASQVDTFETIPGSWLGIELPNKIKLEYVIIKNRDSATIRNVKDGIIWARNDGTTWFRIKDFSGLNTNRNAKNAIQVHQTIAYNEYRLQFTKIYPYGGSGGSASIGELELFGLPEYDPDAHGTDVTVKSYPNVPNTDWLEVYYDAKGLGNGSTTVNDLKPVGTANNGTVGGNTSVTDEAFTFDGTGDYITSTVTTGTGNQSFSVACWFKFTTLGGLLWGFTGTTDGTDNSPSNNSTPHAYFNTTGSINFDFWANATVTAEKLIEANRWYAGVWTYDGTTRKIYIDGTQVHLPQSSTPLSIIDNTSRLSIGIYPTNLSGGPMTGSVANFRLFNRALTQDEIYQLYAYQKEDFGHGDLSMTLKAGRLGIGTSEPRAALDVRGDIYGGCPVFFHATRTAGHLNSATNPIVFNNVVSSKGGGYNSSTGKFTCPIAGYYKIYGYAITDTGGTVWMVLRINDIDQGFGKAYSHTPSPNHTQAHATSIVYLNHNDTVHYRSQGSISGSGTTSNQASANGFIVHYFSS
jgi:hypothetical protein